MMKISEINVYNIVCAVLSAVMIFTYSQLYSTNNQLIILTEKVNQISEKLAALNLTDKEHEARIRTIELAPRK